MDEGTTTHHQQSIACTQQLTSNEQRITPPPRFSIALVSATALAYEILLMRLFSIIQWHHFAYMIISLALLGYGASGTFLALTARRLIPRFPLAYVVNLALFGIATVVCYLAAQQVPFNPQEVLWDPRQPMRLLLLYLLLALPFFFAANAIGLALMRYRAQLTRIYAADLLGAGLGSIGVILLLFVLFPNTVLLVLGALGLVTAALAWWELDMQPRSWAALLLLSALFPAALPETWTDLVMSPYKGLNQTLRVPGTRIIAEHSSPLGLVSLVASPTIPLRHAPGLSLNAAVEPPAQLGLFTDGDNMTAITRYTGNAAQLTHLDQITSALPYHLFKPERVLILGAGGGAGVLQGQYHGIEHIDAVELNPQIAELVRETYHDFSGGLYSLPGVHLYVAEARGFVASSDQSYDLIQVALLDSFAASSAGLYALSESYLYTIEALQEYLRHLKPGGFLALSRWIKLPPRDTLKLFATAIDALQHAGISDPEKRLVLIRGWQTATLLIKNGVFSSPEIAALNRFCEARSFDTAYYPAMPETKANRYNILDQPYFYRGAKALLGRHRDDFLERYKFNLHPATDDRPYFFHFLKWRVLPEIFSLRGKGGMPLLEWGYLILIATLGQTLVISMVLIMLPLILTTNKIKDTLRSFTYKHCFAYFFSLGLAFIFIEIAFIQKFILFLHHPLYASAVVLASFLVFAGLGSACANRYARSHRFAVGVIRSITGMVIVGSMYLVLLDDIFSILMGLPIAIKVLLSICLIAPLAFCMGMPFPLGLARLGAHTPMLLPWVWGVNGCASVLSAILAALLAIHFGFTTVIILALCLYGFAAWVFARPWGVGN